jgi:DNA modification methylase
MCIINYKEEDKIFDCFSGTAVVDDFARKNSRSFIGYEFNPEFVLASKVRLIKNGVPGTDSFD